MGGLGYSTAFYNLINLGLFTFFIAPGLFSETAWDSPVSSFYPYTQATPSSFNIHYQIMGFI